jgi:hypothetical protein
MNPKLSFFALGYLAIIALLLTVAWQSPGPTAAHKTDRLIGTAQPPFVMERFAG